MPLQVLALNPTLGNKKKKKAAMEQKANKQYRTQSIEKDKYNAILKLAIEEEKMKINNLT